MNTKSVWYTTYPTIGTMITGALFKEFAARKFFRPVLLSSGNQCINGVDIDFSVIDDDEQWIIGINGNCGSVMFVRLFFECPTIIDTDAWPESSDVDVDAGLVDEENDDRLRGPDRFPN